jgi:hypothetical protein
MKYQVASSITMQFASEYYLPFSLKRISYFFIKKEVYLSSSSKCIKLFSILLAVDDVVVELGDEDNNFCL